MDESAIDDLLEDGDDDSKLVRDLRAQLRSQRTKVKELSTENETFKKERRSKSVADVLGELEVDPAYAQWYSEDDSSKEAVVSWVEKNAKLLGYEAKSDEDAETERAAARVSQATSQARPKAPGNSQQELDARLRAAKTPEEADAVFAELANVRVV